LKRFNDYWNKVRFGVESTHYPPYHGFQDTLNEVTNLNQEKSSITIKNEELWFTGNYWKFSTIIKEIDGKKQIIGAESEDKFMLVNKKEKEN
jgi:hypothetical protein